MNIEKGGKIWYTFFERGLEYWVQWNLDGCFDYIKEIPMEQMTRIWTKFVACLPSSTISTRNWGFHWAVNFTKMTSLGKKSRFFLFHDIWLVNGVHHSRSRWVVLGFGLHLLMVSMLKIDVGYIGWYSVYFSEHVRRFKSLSRAAKGIVCWDEIPEA